MEVGKIPVNVLKHSVLKQIHKHNDVLIGGAAIGSDCAVFSLPKGTLMATCHREAAVATCPIHIALQECANNLAAGGADGMGFEITLLLPEGTEHEVLRDIMAEADKTCNQLGMQIFGGQTSVLSSVSEPVYVITGYGCMENELVKPEPMMDIVISKSVGLEGTALLAENYKEAIDNKYPAYLAKAAKAYEENLSVVSEARIAREKGAALMHDASKGGIFAALWEIAQRANLGIDVDILKIPIKQETVEICELLEINPYELLSGGSLVIITEDGEALISELRRNNIEAAIVGRTTKDKAMIVRNAEEIRYLDRPKADEIMKIYRKDV